MGAIWCYLAAGLLMGELTCWVYREDGGTPSCHEYLISVFFWPLLVPVAIRVGLSRWQ